MQRFVSGGKLVDTDAIKDTTGDFRVASTRDGVRSDNSKQLRTTDAGTKASLKGAPIDYGNTDWQELFADCFALYATDPHLLRTVRPHIYAYFAKQFPVSTPAATP